MYLWLRYLSAAASSPFGPPYCVTKRFANFGSDFLIFIGYFIYKNIKKENKNSEFEYVPQEEISEEQLRQTVITLYFLDSNEYKLAPEARTIDSKQLVSNPYEVLINLLI